MNSTAGTSKKDIFYVVVLILTFIVVFVGVAFALFTYLRSQEEGSSAVYTGTLSIEYLDGKIITFRNLIPTNEPSFNDNENIYRNNFKVTNTGSLDSIVEINLNLSVNEFSDDTLMYSLYDEVGEVISNDYINGDGIINITADIELESNETKDFVLMIWINENNENQNKEMKKGLTGLIEVNAGQKIE